MCALWQHLFSLDFWHNDQVDGSSGGALGAASGDTCPTSGCVPGLPGCLLVRSASVPNASYASSMPFWNGAIKVQVQPQVENAEV